MDVQNTIAALREALRASPENRPLRLHLATLLEESGRLSEAEAEYRAVWPQDPTLTQAGLGLGRTLFQQGRFAEAAEPLRQVLLRDDKNAEAYALLARIQAELGDFAAAQRMQALATDLDPDYQDDEFEQSLGEAPSGRRVLRVISGMEKDDRLIQIEKSQITFADVGGLEEVKEQIRMNIIYPFQQPDLFLAYGKKVGGGILLYGPPGCGKTYLAKATAGECNAHFLSVGIEDVLDMWVGESERKLHALFEQARHAVPTVLFFDEVEALGGNRARMYGHHNTIIVNQFLAELDGIKENTAGLLVLGATNSPWNLDPAFRRPGRFDRAIFVPPPDPSARIEILRLHASKKPVSHLDYVEIAKRMKRFSGADIEATVELAAEEALRESLKTGKVRSLTTADLLQALKKLRPSTLEWLETARNYATYSNQTGLYDEVRAYLERKE
jgi:SpoVK/Ycf46/Vps4 family AAA+-type ATPase